MGVISKKKFLEIILSGIDNKKEGGFSLKTLAISFLND
jgi:hypothetical protein